MKSLLYICVILQLALISCSSNNREHNNFHYNFDVKIEQTEAWYDMMPTFDTSNGNFRFFIKWRLFNLSRGYIEIDTGKIDVKDFVISFDNNTIQTENINILKSNEGGSIVTISHVLNEKYIINKKENPKEVSFSFDVIYDSKKIKKVKTSSVVIQKVY